MHPRASRARGAPRRALRQPPLPHLLIRQASCSRHERCASRPPLPSYLPVSRCSKRSSHGTVLTGQACLEPDARETCLPAASPLLPSQLAGAARVPRAEGAPSCSLHARRASRPPLLSCLPNLAGAPSCSTHARRASRPPLLLHLLNLAGVPRAQRTHILLTRQALSLLRANRRPARTGLTRVRLPHSARAARHTGRRGYDAPLSSWLARGNRSGFREHHPP